MFFHHYALEVRNVSATKEFYQKILGFAEEDGISYQGKVIDFLLLDGFRMEILENKQACAKNDRTHLCFEVRNLDQKIELMKNLGHLPSEGPYQLENGWKTVFYIGPDEETIEFLQNKNFRSENNRLSI